MSAPLSGLRPPAPADDSRPALSVIICTRERPDDLRRCLAALGEQTVGPLEIIVVDNAPRTVRTRDLAERAGVRYVTEPRPGLDRARNAGLRVAACDIIAYTDDDAVPLPDWAERLLRALDDADVAAVAGPMLPLELETEAQQLFERYLGGEAGRRDRELPKAYPPDFPAAAAGKVGAGANMAFRREALDAVGPFDEAFDAGTLTRSGGDTEMFGRLLAAGYGLAYEPRARVLHRHRRSRSELRSQLFGYGVGVYAYWTHRILHYRDRLALRYALGTLRTHGIRRLRRALLRRADEVPPDLVLAELLGCFYGPVAYLRARRRAGHPAILPTRREASVR